eukprot:GHVS01104303.1.p2 GENE.GHVS01104303.1~~GHVS01104303.1.p2  ORF type:complete len:137 (-),score=5.67 GHVS01104303.1:258-668(-)
MTGSQVVLHSFTQMNVICGVSTRHTFASKHLSQLARPFASPIECRPSITTTADWFPTALMERADQKGNKMNLRARQGSQCRVGSDIERGLWKWLATWSQKHREQTTVEPRRIVGPPSDVCVTGRVVVKGSDGKRLS